MIRTENDDINFKTKFSNGEHSAISDTTIDKGGSNSGFRPHELLEAAVASCMNMHIRMFAENHNIDVSEVKTEVSLNRNEPESAVFEYKIEIDGRLTGLEKDKLMQIVLSCPIKKTLSKRIDFKNIGQPML
jgi:putative redox protein